MGTQEGQVRPLDADAAATVGDALRVLIQAELDRLVDVAFERIEGKVRQFVMGAATRVVPHNVAEAIDTVVTARLAGINENLSYLGIRQDRLEAKAAAAKLLRFGPTRNKKAKRVRRRAR